MRILSACLVCALAACVQNPDPREPSPELMQRMGFGGWIVIVAHDGSTVRGELLAIDDNTIWVATDRNPQPVKLATVTRADLFTYNSEGGFGLWGLLGTLSTISHGVWLVISAPLWIVTSSAIAGIESRHVVRRFPEDNVAELAKWARFPQGMPKQLTVPAPQRDSAWQLTQQAQQAAREGKCDVVAELDQRVRALDASLHESTFIRDEAIRRCFGLPSLLAPPSGVGVDAGVAP